MKAVPEAEDSRGAFYKRVTGSPRFRKILAVILTSVALLPGGAVPGTPEKAGAGEPVSDSFPKLFRDVAPHRAVFRMEKYLPGPNRTVFSEGRVLVFPGAGLCWMAEKPRRQVWLITDAGISDPDRYRVPESARGERPNPFFSKTMQAFTGLLSGRTRDPGVAYDLELSDSEASKAGVLRMIPRDPGVSRVIREITITVGDSRISGISIEENGGGYTRISFAGDEPASGFDPAPGLEALCHDY